METCDTKSFGFIRDDEDFYKSMSIRAHTKFRGLSTGLLIVIFLLTLVYIMLAINGPSVRIDDMDRYTSFLYWRYAALFLGILSIFFTLAYIHNPASSALFWISMILHFIITLMALVALIFIIIDWTDCASVAWCAPLVGTRPDFSFLIAFAGVLALLVLHIVAIILLFMLYRGRVTEEFVTDAEVNRLRQFFQAGDQTTTGSIPSANVSEFAQTISNAITSGGFYKIRSRPVATKNV